MLQVLPGRATPFVGGGPFRIRLIRPGLIEGRPMADPVIGPLSRVDHAFLDVGTVVPMHQHRNDEILSYMWQGLMVHEDSTGQRVELTPSRLMMMNAGRGFSHEESTPSVSVEMLNGTGRLGRLMNDRYPDIRPSGVREYVARVATEGTPHGGQ